MNAVTTDERPGFLAVYQANLGDGKSLSLQFNVALGATEKDWAQALDVLANVVDRQIARAALPREKNVLTVKQGLVETIAKDIEKLNTTITLKEQNIDPARRNQAPVAQEIANREAQKQALEKVKREVEEQKKLIAELEKKAA